MRILGISALYHDSAAALVVDGEIVAAAQEERFTRVKHDSSFPKEAINFCLTWGNLGLQDLDYVVFYEKPFLKFERLLETYLAHAPKGFSSFSKSMPIWLKEKLFQKRYLIQKLNDLSDREVDWSSKLMFSEHHLSHAASAFFPSPFERAAIITLDGVGEWCTTSIAVGNQNSLKIEKEIHFPHSLGLLYSAFTFYSGFKVNSGEYKLMGLAPYGEPIYEQLIRDNLIDVSHDGSYKLNMDFFDYDKGLKMTNRKFSKLFNGPPREQESEISQREADLAASIQKVTEDVVIKIARSVSKETSEKNLCLAGGVALNCVANGKLFKEGIFEDIWIQPAAGDSGGAVGAALALHHIMLGKPRRVSSSIDSMNGSFLGPEYSRDEIIEKLNKLGAKFHVLEEDELIEKTAKSLVEGLAVGWMNGRMEFGPRALGARSILADPRSPNMQRDLNMKIKFRESFRPFAPSVLSTESSKWFELDRPSPYMLVVAEVKQDKRRMYDENHSTVFGTHQLSLPRSVVPAITHVDYSARVQTVHEETNARFYKLLKKFKDLSGVPILVNTSFNIRGEPIVCSPEDAFKCFMGTKLDILVIGDAFLLKREQSTSLSFDYRDQHALD